MEAIGVPERDRFQIIDRIPADALIADPEYLGVHRRNVVFVQVTLVRGRSAETKAAFFAAAARQLDEGLLRRHGWTPPGR